MIKKMHEMHMSPEDKLLSNSKDTFSAVNKNTDKTEEVVKAISKLETVAKNKSVEIQGFTGVLNSLKKNNESINELKDYINNPTKLVQKLEEVKSAGLITNKFLKDLIEEVKKPCKIELTLE